MKCTGNNLDNCEKVSSITNGYFIDVSKANPDKVIACTSKGRSCSIQMASQESGYAYIDSDDTSGQSLIVYDSTSLVSVLGSQLQGHAYLDASEPSNKYIITCSEYGCTSEDKIKNLAAGKELYFINGSNPTYLITCEKNKGSCSVGEDPQVSGLFVDGTDSSNGHTILCTSNGCISSKSIVKCSDVSDESAKCKYDNNGTPADLAKDHYCIKEDSNIYYTVTDSSCGDVEDGTYLFKSDGTAVALDEEYTGNDAGIIFTCDSGECLPLISSHFLSPVEEGSGNKPTYMYECDAHAQCKKMTTIKAEIYINGIPGISATPGLTYSDLVQCTSADVSTCDSIDVSDSNDNYYIDADSTLIKCNTSVCERIETPDLGFYVNAGDTEVKKYIQCGGNGCKAIAETNFDCSLSSHIGQLTSEEKICIKEGGDGKKETPAIGDSDAVTGEYIYLIGYNSNSIFKYFINQNTYFGIVLIKEKSIVLASKQVLDENSTNNYKTLYCFDEDFLLKGSCSGGDTKYACNTDGICVADDVAPPTIPRKSSIMNEEEDTSASNFKIECDILTGTNCKNYHKIF